MVRTFHEVFGLTENTKPQLVDESLNKLRVGLIQEELLEYAVALREGNIVDVADALGDLLYVVLGAAVTHGIDIEPVFDEIHRSNMTKVGGHKDEAGKWIKPATYEPARIAQIIMQQQLACTQAGKEAFDGDQLAFDFSDSGTHIDVTPRSPQQLMREDWEKEQAAA